MPKIVNLDLINSIRKPKEMVDELLDKQVEQLEVELGSKSKGIGNKVLALFVKNGNRVQLTIEEVANYLEEKNGLNRTAADGILFTLLKSGILRQTKGERLELANNFLAQRADQKIEAENRVLRTMRATIQDRLSRNEMLDERYLNYIGPSLVLLDLNEEEEKFVKKSQKAVRRRKRALSTFITIMFLLLLGMASWAFSNYNLASGNLEELTKAYEDLEREKYVADSLTGVANDALEAAQIARNQAVDAEAEARLQADRAFRQKAIADSLRREAIKARDSLLIKTEELRKLRDQAVENAKNLQVLKDDAEASRLVAEENRIKAEELREKALLLNKIITSRIAASRTLQLTDKRTRAMVALEAYNINRAYPDVGDEYHPSIFKSLYTAAATLDESLEYNNQGPHIGAIRDIVVTDNGNTFYTAGSDGRIFRWNISDWNSIGRPNLKKTQLERVIAGGVQNIIAVSPDQQKLLVGGQPPFLQIVNRKTGQLVDTITSPGGLEEIFSADFMGQDNNVFAMGKDHAYEWDGSRLLKLDKLASTVGFTIRDGDKTTAYNLWGTYSENKYALNIETFTGTSSSIDEYNFLDKNYAQEVNYGQITAADHRKINDQLGYTVYGFSTGKIMIIEADLSVSPFVGPQRVFIPHRAAISDIAFSPSGRFLAIASYDRSVTIWDTQRYKDPAYEPFSFDNLSGWSISLAFVKEDRLLVGCSDGNLYFWNLLPEDYAHFICSSLEANQEVSATEQRAIYKSRKEQVAILNFDELSRDEYVRYFGDPERKRMPGHKDAAVKILCK
ncbi:MAG: hypothetical protein DHS20C18_08950 [Saprospiraceae bacterium]|nr:MAG: hypothetical protein DHS20C18_08950 [Saprospiraceae bacterium]